MHSSIYIANRFLELAKEAGVYVSPMKIIKLVYIAHGWMLGIHSSLLIKETVEAWRYGPVIPELYQATKKYLRSTITKPLKCADGGDLSTEEEDIIKQTFNVYGRKSALDLSYLTHMEGTPWMDISGGEGSGEVIPNDLIDDYYKQLISHRKSG